jgi:hypothetical protein
MHLSLSSFVETGCGSSWPGTCRTSTRPCVENPYLHLQPPICFKCSLHVQSSVFNSRNVTTYPWRCSNPCLLGLRRGERPFYVGTCDGQIIPTNRRFVGIYVMLLVQIALSAEARALELLQEQHGIWPKSILLRLLQVP